MMSYSAARRWLGCFLFACGSAQAVTVDLGEIVAPLSWQIDQYSPAGPFVDRFTFAVVADEPLMFSSFVTTGFSNRHSISAFRGQLFSDGVLLDTGDAQTTYMPEGFPAQSVNFDTLLLGRGDYELRFSGTAHAFDPNLHFGAGYSGSAEFRAVQAVPEPSMLWLAGLGLTALVWSGFAKRRATGAALVIVLPETGLGEAMLTAERLRKAIESDLQIAGNEALRVTASFEVAQHRPGESAELMIQEADSLMYLAKDAGRNRVFPAIPLAPTN